MSTTTESHPKPFLQDFFLAINEILEEKGDFDFIIDADLELRGESEDRLGQSRYALSQLEPDSVAFAQVLIEQFDLKQGDVVHMVLPNMAAFYPPIFGVWMAGGVISSADVAVTARNMADMIDDCKAKIVVCGIGNLDHVKEALGDRDHVHLLVLGQVDDIHKTSTCGSNVVFYEPLKASLSSCSSMSSLSSRWSLWSDSDLAVIFWSSGTTGKPKGIKHAFRLMRQLMIERHARPSVPRVLLTTCFHHTGGFMYPLLNLLNDAITFFLAPTALELVAEGKDAISKVFRAIDKFEVNFMMAGTHHVIRAANYNFDEEDQRLKLHSLAVAAAFGSAFPLTTPQRLKERCSNLKMVLNNFGLSEAGTFITERSQKNSIGYVAKDRAVKIVHPDTWETLGPMEQGLMLVKTPYLMMGYLNSDEKAFDDDGWLITGDIGHYDESGLYYHVSRVKDLIKVENNHLYPMEVETVLNSHPDVTESAVFGVPDPVLMERVTAAVVIKKDSKVTEEELVNLVKDNLEPFKAIRGGVKFVEQLPKNTVGKMLRRELPRMLEQKLIQ